LRLRRAGGEDGVHGIDNFGAATVVEGDGENHAGVFGGGFDGLAGVCLDGVWQLFWTTEKAHADIVFLEQRHFFAEVFAKELHEEFDFCLWAAPVVDGKSVKGESFDVQARAGFDGHAGGLRTGAVSGDAGEMTLLGPAAVAIHDDGDMTGEAGKIESLQETGFLGGDGAEGFRGDAMAVRRGQGDIRMNPLYGAKLTYGVEGMQLEVVETLWG
jgi:hypothetical protein